MRGRMTRRRTGCSTPCRQVGSTGVPLCRRVIRLVEVPSLARSRSQSGESDCPPTATRTGEVGWLIPVSTGPQWRLWLTVVAVGQAGEWLSGLAKLKSSDPSGKKLLQSGDGQSLRFLGHLVGHLT